MYPAKFEYHRAHSIQEALDLLKKHSGAKLLAGGHSLIPMMKLRLAQPPVVVDIGRISELGGISQENGHLRIGSLTTHAELARSEMVQKYCPILSQAAAQIADPQVRNKGTIGGNLAHADPGSDLPAVTLALNGIIHLTGLDGDRQVQASDFFVDLLVTELQAGEVLAAVELPVLDSQSGSSYLKFEHPASGYAVCGAAAVVRIGNDGSCQQANLCFNGVTAVPFNASPVGTALSGQNLEDAVIDQAVTNNLVIEDPMGDIFASGPYRVELAKVYGRRALKAARDDAQS